jgi:hypothetical protein
VSVAEDLLGLHQNREVLARDADPPDLHRDLHLLNHFPLRIVVLAASNFRRLKPAPLVAAMASLSAAEFRVILVA